LHQKQLTQGDLLDLKMCVSALSTVPGVGVVVPPEARRDLLTNGGAYVVVVITREHANLIWQMMGMSIDGARSAYHDVMTGTDLRFAFSLFKAGPLFSTVYIASAEIAYQFQKKSMKVDCGSVAAKRISGVVERMRKLLMGQQPIAHSTEEALGQMT
jgi:hypothetical protein